MLGTIIATCTAFAIGMEFARRHATQPWTDLVAQLKSHTDDLKEVWNSSNKPQPPKVA